MTHEMSAEIFMLNSAAFGLVPPVGGLLVKRNATAFALNAQGT